MLSAPMSEVRKAGVEFDPTKRSISAAQGDASSGSAHEVCDQTTVLLHEACIYTLLSLCIACKHEHVDCVQPSATAAHMSHPDCDQLRHCEGQS